MTELNVMIEVGPHTNEDALNDWMKGLPGLVKATNVREYVLTLRDDADIDEIRQRLKTCQYADVIGDELVGDERIIVTNSGLATLAGCSEEDIAGLEEDTESFSGAPDDVDTPKTPHTPLVTQIGDDEMLISVANTLNGSEYPLRLNEGVEELIEKNGMILISGRSDDLTCFKGAFSDEHGAYNGNSYFWTGAGFAPSCSEVYIKEDNATELVASWSPDDKDCSWGFETTATRWAKFDIMEDDLCYSEALLVYKDDLTPFIEKITQPDVSEITNDEGAVDETTEEEESSDTESNGDVEPQDQDQNETDSPQTVDETEDTSDDLLTEPAVTA